MSNCLVCFTGNRCLFSIWTLFKSPGHWSSLFSEYLVLQQSLIDRYWKAKLWGWMKFGFLVVNACVRIGSCCWEQWMKEFDSCCPWQTFHPNWLWDVCDCEGYSVGSFQYSRCASWSVWYSCNWLHSSTWLGLTTFSLWSPDSTETANLINSCVVCNRLRWVPTFAGGWDDVFKVAVGLYLFGTVVWNVFSTGEQLFD